MKRGLPRAALLVLLPAVVTFASCALISPRPDAAASGFSEEHCERRLEETKGRLRPPVTGAVMRRFGRPGENGLPSESIVLRTQPEAQAAAPFDSTIAFARFYRDYGALLILSTCDGYHFVLRGMTKIYGVVGQKVLEGEPVGRMPDAGTDDAHGASTKPELHFEIRRNGKPLDPLPWLAAAGLERTSQ